MMKTTEYIRSVIDKLHKGYVFTYNDLALQEELGSTSHHPRYRIAFKFQGESKQTKINSIFWGVSRNGTLTPVAKVEPVHLAGVTVSSISLHNEEFIMQKDLRIGDKVLIERAGDVIPYIVKAFPDLRDGSQEKIEFPKQCPSCEWGHRKHNKRLLTKDHSAYTSFTQKILRDKLILSRLWQNQTSLKHILCLPCHF